MKVQIAQLSHGESYTRCRKLALDRVTRERMSQEVTDLKNTVNSAMRRAANDTGADYTLDNLQLITPTKDVMLIAVVTRTA
jgi:hypothetical protein